MGDAVSRLSHAATDPGMVKAAMRYGTTKVLALAFMMALAGFVSLPNACEAAWVEGGVRLAEEWGAGYPNYRVIPDGAGGIYVAGMRSDNSFCSCGIFFQHLDADGMQQLGRDGVIVAATDAPNCHCFWVDLLADGEGGCYIAWYIVEGDHATFFVQRVDGDGEVLWDQPIEVTSPYKLWRTAGLESLATGLNYLFWSTHDWPATDTYGCFVYAFDGEGSPVWSVDPLAVFDDYSRLYSLSATSGPGARISLAWSGIGPLESGVFAQQFDANGTKLWGDGGVIVDDLRAEAVAIAAGDQADVFVAWTLGNFNVNVYYGRTRIAHLDALGSLTWPDGALAICNRPSIHDEFAMCADHQGGALIGWGESDDLYLQRIDRQGNRQFGADGLAICTRPYRQSGCQMESSSSGLAYMIWEDMRNDNGDVYAQCIDQEGQVLWGEDGLLVNARDSDSSRNLVPRIASVSGGAVVTWADIVEGRPSDSYILKATRSGIWEWVVNGSKAFGTTVLGDTIATPYTLFNRTVSPLSLRTASPPDGGEFFFTPSFADSLSAGVTLAAHTSLSTQLHFSPQLSGRREVEFHLMEVVSGDTLAATTCVGEGRAIGLTWSSSALYPDRLLEVGEDLLVQEILADAVEVDSLVLFHSVGGSPVYARLPMVRSYDDPVNDLYTCIVPAEELGARGLEFFVSAYNGPVVVHAPDPSAPICFRTMVENLEFDVAQPAGEYTLISFPLALSENSVLDVLYDDLGAPDATRWRLYGYSPQARSYVELPDPTMPQLEQGAGYWLISRESVVLNTGPRPFATTPTDSAYRLELQPGYNLVGNPFAFAVPWDSVRVDGQPMAEAEGVLVGAPDCWEPGRGYTSTLGTPVTVLEPFRGYWVENLATEPVALNIPPRDSSAVVPVVKNEAAGWMLEVRARSGEYGGGVSVGHRPGSAEGRDRFDQGAAPMPPGGSWVRFEVEAPDGLPQGGLVRDLRPLHGVAGARWNVSLRSAEAGEVVVLSAEAMGVFPAGWTFELIDLDQGVLVGETALTGGHAVITGGTARPCRYALVAGTMGYVLASSKELVSLPGAVELDGNVPNPFNPMTRIRFGLPEVTRVSLGVYGLRGERVASLVAEEEMPAGYHVVVWDGRDERGRPAASGVYVYRLQTPDRVMTRKMTMMR